MCVPIRIGILLLPVFGSKRNDADDKCHGSGPVTQCLCIWTFLILVYLIFLVWFVSQVSVVVVVCLPFVFSGLVVKFMYLSPVSRW